MSRRALIAPLTVLRSTAGKPDLCGRLGRFIHDGGSPPQSPRGLGPPQFVLSFESQTTAYPSFTLGAHKAARRSLSVSL